MRLAALAFAFAVVVGPGSARAGGVRRPAPTPELAPRPTAQITGRVVDPAGKALAGVTVVATHAATDADRRRPAPRRVRSDRDGQFRFALPPGEYVFVALDRELTGATPAMAVARALEVVLVVTRALTSA